MLISDCQHANSQKYDSEHSKHYTDISRACTCKKISMLILTSVSKHCCGFCNLKNSAWNYLDDWLYRTFRHEALIHRLYNWWVCCLVNWIHHHFPQTCYTLHWVMQTAECHTNSLGSLWISQESLLFYRLTHTCCMTGNAGVRHSSWGQTAFEPPQDLILIISVV